MILLVPLAAASDWNTVLDTAPERTVEIGALIGLQGTARAPMRPGFALGGEVLFRLRHKATLLAGFRGHRFVGASTGIFGTRSGRRYRGGYVAARVGFMSNSTPWSFGVMLEGGALVGNGLDRSLPIDELRGGPTLAPAARLQFSKHHVYGALELGPSLSLVPDVDFRVLVLHGLGSMTVGVYL